MAGDQIVGKRFRFKEWVEGKGGDFHQLSITDEYDSYTVMFLEVCSKDGAFKWGAYSTNGDILECGFEDSLEEAKVAAEEAGRRFLHLFF